jgi:hypothetical protein
MAYAAAERADQTASIAIRVLIRNRIKAGAAIAEARTMLSPEAFVLWLSELDLPPGPAASALAECWEALTPEKRRRNYYAGPRRAAGAWRSACLGARV